MNRTSTLLQTLALAALLAAQVHGAITMPGVRQALRIIGGQPAPIFCSSAIQIAAVGPSNMDATATPSCP